MSDWTGLDAAFAELEADLSEVVVGMSVELWDGILKKTPQFYGRMTASWSYSLDAPNFVDRSEDVDFEGPRKTQIGNLGPSQGLFRGHPAAIGVANAANAGKAEGYKLGRTIWIANGVDHGEGPYSSAVEEGKVPLRAVNQPGAPLSRTLDTIQARYGEDVKPFQAQRLKSKRLGANAG